MGQLQPSTHALRPEPLPSVKEAGFLSRKSLLLQIAFIGRQVVAFRSSHRKEIATFVFDMASMPLDPLPLQFVPPTCRIETFPQILIPQSLARTPPPSQSLPLPEPTTGHRIDKIL